MKMIRQGDVLLKGIEKPPSGEITRCEVLTLAYGEATGHHHTLYPSVEGGLVDEIIVNGKRFIQVETEFFLRHQEHRELRIPPGVYEIIIEREYDPFDEAMKRVVD
jgi:hypothetical protein